jgi:ribosome-associated protein
MAVEQDGRTTAMNEPEDEFSHDTPRKRFSRADPDAPSRGARRKEALDVLALAHALAELSEAQLVRVPLSDDLRELVATSRAVHQHVARKRQLGFLAKKLRVREDELPAIRAALEHDRDSERRETARLHRAEAWRDRLLGGGDEALTALLAAYPDADRQQLRTLVRRAADEAQRGKPPAAAREVFRILRELIGE